MSIDVFGWAFDDISHGIMKGVTDNFDVEIVAEMDKPNLDDYSYDLLHVFGARSMHHRQFDKKNRPLLKGFYNTTLPGMSAPTEEIYNLYANEADAITVPISSMYNQLIDMPVPIYLAPEGIDTDIYIHTPRSRDQLVVGWVGNPSKSYKRFSLAQEACKDLCEFRVADGTLSVPQVVEFYNSIDVILCTAMFGEGCPRPLIEGLSTGCFPVSFRVGVAPEVITNGINGLLVDDESVDGVRDALGWCQENIKHVRAVRNLNRERMCSTRDWLCFAPAMNRIYKQMLGI